MDIYDESNRENTSFFCPDIKDPEEAKRKVEEGFLEYLENEFLHKEGNSIYVLEERGIYLSALRLNLIRDHLYYIEVLETRPDSRDRRYASAPRGPHRGHEEERKLHPRRLHCEEQHSLPENSPLGRVLYRIRRRLQLPREHERLPRLLDGIQTGLIHTDLYYESKEMKK